MYFQAGTVSSVGPIPIGAILNQATVPHSLPSANQSHRISNARIAKVYGLGAVVDVSFLSP